MSADQIKRVFSRFVASYGMVFVLLLLCVFFSVATWNEQHPTGATAANQVAAHLVSEHEPSARVLIVAGNSRDDTEFAEALRERLAASKLTVVDTVLGQPVDARKALEVIAVSGDRLDVIAASPVSADWPVFEGLQNKFPSLASAKLVTAGSYWWPDFLKVDNLRNIPNQIAVIAILAVAMTMVIITGGIDLSVGSLIALSAVVWTLLIRDLAGAETASAVGMAVCALGTIAVCAGIGVFSGLMVLFRIAPFIVTLAMMLVARGLAYILAEGQSIYQVPDSSVWLGRGADLFGLPNPVVLMVLIYVAAHVVMTYTTFGRYIYAVGGNAEAARLSGVPVRRVLLSVYTISGILAGLGGIVSASELKSGSPTYAPMYELYVIAAVVVGGTSLTGGEGKIFGTLVGAFIIAVIRNGMNLTDVESYTQMVILGLVILGAALLDEIKKRGWIRRCWGWMRRCWGWMRRGRDT